MPWAIKCLNHGGDQTLLLSKRRDRAAQWTTDIDQAEIFHRKIDAELTAGDDERVIRVEINDELYPEPEGGRASWAH